MRVTGIVRTYNRVTDDYRDYCAPAGCFSANGRRFSRGQVTIYRDTYGVPHIAGETEEATFFGYGHAQAQDHLERMMVQYLDAQGRRAEVQGFEALGDGYLHFIPYEYRWDGDYLQRLLRTKKGVAGNRDQIPPGVYRILDAFARGVNFYIRENRARIPAWIEEITAEDVEALERSHYFRFYSIHDALSKLLGTTYSFPHLGSNQWAVARGKSANGRVMHVEHTHMPWANRFQNYEAHLMTPGKLNAGGISWFGSPFFLDGFNDRITWSATYNNPNIADVYEEKLKPDDHTKYGYDGRWRAMRVEQETFRVRGPKGMETITLPLYYTHHGPVVKVDRTRHRAWSVKLPNFENVTYSAALYGLMKARDLAEFKAVVGRQWMPRWNLLYSDAKSIYWVHNGTVPLRPAGFDWSKPVPGWTSATEWTGFVPFEQYPQVLDPPSGFLQNCNNPPWFVTTGSELKSPVPYYLHSPDADLNTRGERLLKVLGGNRKFSLADMIDLAFDTYIVAADVFIPLLEATNPRDKKARRAMALLKEWDRFSSADSTAYTIAYFFGRAYQDLFAGPFSRFSSPERTRIDIGSAEEQKMAAEALREGLHRLEKRFQSIEVPWGRVNITRRGGDFPMDGTGLYGVLHPDVGIEQEDGRILCNDGWGHAMVTVEGDPKEIWTLLPYGQSEDPSSPHYNDQTILHSRRQLKRFWFTPAEILNNTKSVWGKRERLGSIREQ